MGYQVDAGFAARGRVLDLVDGQAHAVDGDGAFVRQVTCQRARCQHSQLPAFTHLGKVGDLADAIHMARHDVATEPVMGAQGFFEVDGAGCGQPGGLVQRFGRNVDRELVLGGVKGGDGHTGTIERNTVAQAHVVEVAGGRLQGETLAVL